MGRFLFALIPVIQEGKQLQNQCNCANQQADDGNYDRNDLKTSHTHPPLSLTIPEGTRRKRGNRPLEQTVLVTILTWTSADKSSKITGLRMQTHYLDYMDRRAHIVEKKC